MKMTILILLCLVLILMPVLVGCSNNSSTTPTTQETVEETAATQDTTTDVTYASVPESLSVLFIGNSFSVDTMEHFADIAKAAGVKELFLGNLYVGGCPIAKHHTFLKYNQPEYKYWQNLGFGWYNQENYISSVAITSRQWDWIAIQHGSSGGASSYCNPDDYQKLPELVSMIKELAGENTRIAFNMTWVDEPDARKEIRSYNNDQLAMLKDVCTVTRDIVATTPGVDKISPAGMAIQDARTAYDGLLTRDGYHLSKGLGRYIVGLTFFQALTGCDISGIEWAPGGVTAEERALAIRAATTANQTPYEVVSLAE